MLGSSSQQPSWPCAPNAKQCRGIHSYRLAVVLLVALFNSWRMQGYEQGGAYALSQAGTGSDHRHCERCVEEQEAGPEEQRRLHLQLHVVARPHADPSSDRDGHLHRLRRLGHYRRGQSARAKAATAGKPGRDRDTESRARNKQTHS